LANHPYPISIILGDHDFIDFGGGMYRKWVTAIPKAHLEMIKNTGHNAWLDDPSQFHRLLLRALSRSTQQGR